VHPQLCALLLPEWPENERIGGPKAYVTKDGQIGIADGLTEYTDSDLLFTGRYNHA